jgi:hypothetical protein
LFKIAFFVYKITISNAPLVCMKNHEIVGGTKYVIGIYANE